MADNVSILDLMLEKPADVHLPYVCRDVCHTTATRLDSLDAASLYSLSTKLYKTGCGGDRETVLSEDRLCADVLDEQQSLLDQPSARFSLWG